MKKFFVLIVSILILMDMTAGVSARRVHHISHRARIVRLYRRAYYRLRHHRSYKRAFRKLYRTESKYNYSYTFRPKATHNRLGLDFRFSFWK